MLHSQSISLDAAWKAAVLIDKLLLYTVASCMSNSAVTVGLLDGSTNWVCNT